MARLDLLKLALMTLLLSGEFAHANDKPDCSKTGGFFSRLFSRGGGEPTMARSTPSAPIAPTTDSRALLSRPFPRYQSGGPGLEFKIPAAQIELAAQKVDRELLNTTYFLVPNNDGEARRAAEILGAAKAPHFKVSQQGWGAELQREMGLPSPKELRAKGIKRLVAFEIPGLEAEAAYRAAGIEVLPIDHHFYKQVDRTRPESSLEQLASLIQWPVSRTDEALAVNDRGYIPGLKKMKMSPEEISAVRRYDLIAQGREEASVIQQVEEARAAIPNLPKRGDVYLLDGVSVDQGILKQELSIQSPDGLVSSFSAEKGIVSFSGNPAMAQALIDFPFEKYGYPKDSFAQYGGGDPKASQFFGFKPRIPPAGSRELLPKNVVDEMWKAMDQARAKADEKVNASGQTTAAAPIATRAPTAVGALDPAKGEINYRVLGEKNKETIVLIHGLDSAMATFDNILEPLSKKYKVVVYDQRGHGKSKMIGNDYSASTMAADLKALMDHLGVDKATVLGHSMGARTAAKFAELNPQRVNSLIVEDMEMIRRSAPDPKKLAEYNAMADRLDQQFANKEFPSRAALAAALEPIYGKNAESLTFRRAKENPDGSMTLLFNPGVSLRYGYQANTEDLTEAVKGFGKPALFLTADPAKGSAVSKKGAEAISCIGNACEVKIPGSGHTIHRTNQEEFLQQVDTFMAKNATASNEGKNMPSRSLASADNLAIDPEVKAAGMMPRGSAVATSAGDLEKTGIRQIIHAASGSMTKTGKQFDPTLQGVTDSVKNSLALGKQNGHKRIALPFIGGKIFVDRIGIPAQDLANEIVRSAVKNRDGLEIRFVTFGDEDTRLFKNAVAQEGAGQPAGAVEVLSGSLTDAKLHGATAIVNAANMEIQFGGGLSGVIARATGNQAAIDREAQEAIRKFYEAR